MPILTWEYKGVDVIQLARNKSMPEVLKVKNMDGVVCRYIPERTCHIVKAARKYVLSDGTELFEDGCSECNGYLGDGDNFCPNCGAKVEE